MLTVLLGHNAAILGMLYMTREALPLVAEFHGLMAAVLPEALAVRLAPHGMTGRLHEFDGSEGGGYRMSLFYPADVEGSPGKTFELEDRFSVRSVELSAPRRIVEAITFESDDSAFAGEMRMGSPSNRTPTGPGGSSSSAASHRGPGPRTTRPAPDSRSRSWHAFSIWGKGPGRGLALVPFPLR